MLRLCLALSLIALGTAPLLASSPYAYQMVLTPEEGPIDPAIEKRYSRQFRACQDTAQSTPDNASCFVAEFGHQDAALNAAWKRTFVLQGKINRRALRAAQRKWMAERDPFCRRQADGYSGGTIAPVIYVSCRVELTIRRTLWLEHLAAVPH